MRAKKKRKYKGKIASTKKKGGVTKNITHSDGQKVRRMGKEGKKGSGGMVTHLPPVQKVRLQRRGMLDTGYWTLDSGLSTR